MALWGHTMYRAQNTCLKVPLRETSSLVYTGIWDVKSVFSPWEHPLSLKRSDKKTQIRLIKKELENPQSWSQLCYWLPKAFNLSSAVHNEHPDDLIRTMMWRSSGCPCAQAKAHNSLWGHLMQNLSHTVRSRKKGIQTPHEIRRYHTCCCIQHTGLPLPIQHPPIHWTNSKAHC